MISVLRSTPAAGGVDRVNQAVRELEDERRRGGDRGVEAHWRGADPAISADVTVLAALVKSDLRHRFSRGESPAVAEYLERFPELRESGGRVLSLIYEEFCLREERGEGVGVESFCDRYPDWRESLASQLQYHRLISQAAGIGQAAPKFPQPGDSFGEFELDSVLGTGGSSRVFLARDTSLGNRVVVLKVAVDRGNEPMILGGLVHPRIVWVNSVAYQPESQLRGLSMPYHPGLPLDEIVKGLDPSSLPRQARVFWDALEADKAAKSPKRGNPEGDGWNGFPINGSYPEGVAWIGKVLADALYHAHGKETFHRDIKPGNVLMTLSRGPQLLDFNLAESPHSAERADDALRGGTLPYMAPEQIAAFLDPTRWDQVGAQADIYSLGLVLRELLTGRLPDLPDETLSRSRALADFLDRRAGLNLSVRRLNPTVPHALEAIVARCLEFDPEARYPDAAALALDLERFLQHRPLLVARNPCRRERLENWHIRNRRLVKLGIAGAIAAATLLDPLPIERAPAFTKAVQLLPKPTIQDDDRAASRVGASANIFRVNLRERSDEMITPLKSLAAAYPQSPLPHLFMSLALDASDRDDHRPAEQAFRKAMAIPDATEIVVAWAKAHPELALADWIDHFGEHCLKRASEIEPHAAGNPAQGSVRPQAPEPLVALASQAYDLALRIDPGRGRSIHGVATFEESQGRYSVASDLVTRCLSALGEKSRFEDPGERHSLLLSRARIAVAWAEKVLRQHGPNARRAARDLLSRAISDLDDGDRLGSISPGIRFRALYIRTMAALTLAETQLDLNQLEEARRRIGEAEDAFGKLTRTGSEILNRQKIQDRLDEASRRAGAAAQTQNARTSPTTSILFDSLADADIMPN